ncbi:hypothetical protein OH76DRAFT_328655 [Lentinus brumalis]|uniref:Uncharacterized protein n=1 Tax=Lentinus brumalis TaxID=2498619 RepID=A0A371DFU1_9APHY|nr:hypothetical protein OH76DRAFT_328655 [Polyporus brumalis]
MCLQLRTFSGSGALRTHMHLPPSFPSSPAEADNDHGLPVRTDCHYIGSTYRHTDSDGPWRDTRLPDDPPGLAPPDAKVPATSYLVPTARGLRPCHDPQYRRPRSQSFAERPVIIKQHLNAIPSMRIAQPALLVQPRTPAPTRQRTTPNRLGRVPCPTHRQHLHPRSPAPRHAAPARTTTCPRARSALSLHQKDLRASSLLRRFSGPSGG